MHPLLRRLKKASLGSTDVELLSRAAEAMSLGGRAGLLTWLRHRQQMARHQSEQELLTEIWGELAHELLNLDSKAAAAEVARLAAVEAASAANRQRQVREAAVKRERVRRAADPRGLIRERLERVMAAPAADRPTESPMQPQPQPQRQYSRQCLGECGQRIGAKLDILLADVRAMDIAPQHPKPRLVWSRSHGEDAEPETFTIPRSADPPSSGGVDNSAGATAATVGGDGGGFPNAWGVVANQGQSLSDLREFLESVDQDPALRAAATLRALDRLRDALEGVPEGAALDAPVMVAAGDAALLARQLLSRLR